jgi:hypothetical protein
MVVLICKEATYQSNTLLQFLIFFLIRTIDYCDKIFHIATVYNVIIEADYSIL